jgi:hypothetical protein
MKFWQHIALISIFLIVAASAVSAQNLLTNPGFNDGYTGWTFFNNAYVEAANPLALPAAFVPYEGTHLATMFGNWSGPWNVSGCFQDFPTTAGEAWRMDVWSKNPGGDPLQGQNYVIMKLVWFNAANAEIGGVEATVLDSSTPVDVWIDNAPIIGYAPAGCVKVQALLLFLQPNFEGGAGHLDYAELYKSGTVPNESETWGSIKSLYDN